MGQATDSLGKPNRKICSHYLSLMDKCNVRLDAFGDSSVPVLVVTAVTRLGSSCRTRTSPSPARNGIVAHDLPPPRAVDPSIFVDDRIERDK
jgi:hypothetical protein